MRPTQEQREHPRKLCCLSVDGVAWNCVFKAFARDISPCGAFIETPHHFPTDEYIILSFNVPPLYTEPIEVVGRTAWTNSGGIGVEFTEVPLSLTTMIESFG